MNALFEDGGKFQVGRVMTETDTSLQVELGSGKRAKVKAANVLLRFAQPEPEALLGEAEAIAGEIDLDLAWEFAPEGEFAFAELARDYFGTKAGVAQEAAALLRLFSAPHYFRRLGKGRFKKAPEEIVKAALLGIERKKQIAAQVDAWAAELIAGNCPLPVREHIYRILFKPDKNAVEYKAVVEAARRSGRPPLDVLKSAGAIDSPYEFHWRRFLFEEFPKGTGFADVAVPEVAGELGLAPAQAFSIDDSSTTEIDDALSVQGLGSGKVVVGIHIAAPALAFLPATPIAQIARDRLSTVYIPGHKLTMLPDAVVEAFTLAEGTDAAVVSLYVTFDEASLATLASETRLERIRIAANLRHDLLEAQVDESTIAAGLPPSLPFAAELSFLHVLAQRLKAGRERVRGKPENFTRPDYTFRVDRDGGRPITGEERVEIVPRKRGSPLDLIVAEAMILANSTWGGWLAACGVPGIYRSQASLAPGVKVRMGTQPAPHAGIGVAQYAWATSPLRRYVDLVNQWQIVACARGGRSAPLVAPFKPKDVQLLAAIADFEASYAAYNAFQAQIERYWSLRWLQQNDVRELDATVLKEGLVRADALPLVFRAVGSDQLARGSAVRVSVGAVDLLTLDLSGTVVARRDEAATPAETIAGDDEDADSAGPLAIAIDVSAPDPGVEADPVAATAA
ncbi:MAG TPA: RNB domain-containing ribonuclease [Caldimonas sp.]|jgi:exoribonuclease-2|nr:RNB domain-containing ribonuclease [Caldimonas sp.]HEX4233207.1 RNB domain-containing ribonuclease [Caldimonas sp.]